MPTDRLLKSLSDAIPLGPHPEPHGEWVMVRLDFVQEAIAALTVADDRILATTLDPALPETTEGEAWYDAEIAPALAALAQRCNERGMSFVAAVEYQPGSHAGTYSLTAEAHLKMRMLHLCSITAPNVDSYVLNLRRHCKAEGIDTSASFVLRA